MPIYFYWSKVDKMNMNIRFSFQKLKTFVLLSLNQRWNFNFNDTVDQPRSDSIEKLSIKNPTSTNRIRQVFRFASTINVEAKNQLNTK